jgi:hypothetical protein
MQTNPSSVPQMIADSFPQPTRSSKFGSTRGVNIRTPGGAKLAGIRRVAALSIVAATVFSAQVASAANIVWASDFNDPSTGFFPAGARHTDSGFVTLLQNAGHNVIRYNPPAAATTLMTQAEVDALNTNDLIIIGRATGSGAFRLNQGHQWNTAITRPVICMSPYLVRTIADNRMGWFTGDVGPDDTTTFVTAADPASPAVDFLLGGVAMLGNRSVNLFNEVLDRNTSHMLNTPVAGGRTLLTATFAQENNGAIATAQLITDFPAGTVTGLSNAPLAAYRLYMAGGSREGTSFPQSIPLYTGRENLTPAGEDIFLRAVQLALNSGTPPATDPLAPVGFTSQPASVTVLRGGSVTLSVSVTGAAPRTLEWQRDTGDGVTFTNIPDAATSFLISSITLTNLDPADSGAKFRVVATNPNGTATSDLATLTVTPDGEPPVALSAATLDGAALGVCFNELLDNRSTGNTATDPFNYTLVDPNDPLNGVNAVQVRPDGRSAILSLSAPITGAFTLTVAGVEDRHGNAIPPEGISLAGANPGFTLADVGTPAPAGTSFACATDSFVIGGGATTGGSGTLANDIQPTAEHMRLAYKSISGDFDARVRVDGIAGSDRLEAVAKALLTARAATDAAAMSVNAFVTAAVPGDGSFGSTARTTVGGATASNFVAVAYAPNSVPATFPAWLRIRRAGDAFTTFGSVNGTDWTQLGSITVAMGPTALVGAGANSHRNGRLAFATFSNLTITQAPDQPTLTGLAYTGGNFSASFQSQNGFTYTIQYKDDLNDSAWQNLTTIVGDGAIKTFTDIAPLPTHRFYQVAILP